MKFGSFPEVRTLPNGLCVICEVMPAAESVAYELVLPGGIVCDPGHLGGLSLILSEMLSRGAGPYDSRALSDEFDKLGMRHSENAGQDRYVLRGMCLKGDERRGLELLAELALRPHLPESHLESIKDLLLLDIDALKDAPADRVSLALHQKYFRDPYGRSPYGDVEGIKDAGIKDLAGLHQRLFRPSGSILSVSGAFDQEEIADFAGQLFAGWEGEAAELVPAESSGCDFYEHVQDDKSAQQYLAAAFPSVPFGHPQYYVVRVLSEILSGGMFGRLFLELREKRGLCYSVFARYSAGKDSGTLSAHASTTPENCGELVAVLIDELQHAAEGLRDDELARAKVNVETSLILSEEGVSSACSGNAGDWWFIRRIRPLEEIQKGINRVCREAIIEYLETHPPQPFGLVTLGRKRLL